MRILLFFAALIALCSCDNNLTSIGQDLIDNGTSIDENRYKVYNTATIKLDSFITSGGKSYNVNEMFVGSYSDDYSGTTTATPYFAIAPGATPMIETNYVYDSVTLNFKYTGHIWGDTTSNELQKLELWQMKQTAVPLEDQNDFIYNTYSVPLERKLGEVQYIPRRANLMKTYFKLDDTFGREMWEKMKVKNDFFDGIWEFINYFHGVAIKPVNNNCIIGFNATSDSLYMRFHYHTASGDSYIDFRLVQKELQFNSIINEPAPLFESLTDQLIQKPLTMGSVAMLQGLSGYMVKMTLPKLNTLEAYSTLIKVELEVPVFAVAKPRVGMPSKISVYQTNNKNEVKSALPNSISAGTVVTGSYQSIIQNNKEDRYVFDLTEYYERMINTPSASSEDYQILLSVPGFGSTFDRVIINEVPVLKVYFAKYKL